jgi:hypothetical protein
MNKKVGYNIDKIADWIINMSDAPRDEVKWLLEQVYIPSNQRLSIHFDSVVCPDIQEDYSGVFDYLDYTVERGGKK